MQRNGLILFSIPIGVFLILYFGFNFNGLYGQDSHEYYRFANELQSCFVSGDSPGAFFWPLAYPLIGSVISYPVGDSLLVLQLISVLSLSLSGWFVYSIIKKMIPEQQAFWLVLIVLTTSGYLVRSSVIVMSDALCVLSISGVLFFYERLTGEFNLRRLACFAMFCSLSIMVRYPSVLLISPFVLIVGIDLLRNKRILGILLSLALFALVITPHFILRSGEIFGFMEHGWLVNWSAFNFFKRDFHPPSGIHHHLVPNILFVMKPLFHPGFVSILGISWIFTRRGDLKWVYVFGVGLYLLFMAGIGMQNTRFLIITMPLVVVLLANPFSRLISRFNRFTKGMISVMIVLNIALILLALKPVYSINRIELAISKELPYKFNRPIYSFGIDVAMKSYIHGVEWLDMYSEIISTPEKSAYILFNEAQLREQWKDEVLFDNWRIFKKTGITKVKKMSFGWTLYEFK